MRGYLSRWVEGEEFSAALVTPEPVRHEGELDKGQTHEATAGSTPRARDLLTDEDPNLSVAQHEIATLLTTAYRRSVTLARAVEDQATSGNRQLANSAAPSVHGVVP
jgi:hypothetical protein